MRPQRECETAIIKELKSIFLVHRKLSSTLLWRNAQVYQHFFFLFPDQAACWLTNPMEDKRLLLSGYKLWGALGGREWRIQLPESNEFISGLGQRLCTNFYLTTRCTYIQMLTSNRKEVCQFKNFNFNSFLMTWVYSHSNKQLCIQLSVNHLIKSLRLPFVKIWRLWLCVSPGW